tara:strand:- start:1743 stop:2432 length:690 start_codon:yes stop_codon:yes gene_type:complete
MAKCRSRTRNNHSKKRVKKVKRVKKTVRSKNQKGSGFFRKLGKKSKEAARIVGSKTKEGVKVIGYHGSLKKLQMNKNNFENKINNLKKLCKELEILQPKIDGKPFVATPSWSDCYQTPNEKFVLTINGIPKQLADFNKAIETIKQEEGDRRVQREKSINEKRELKEKERTEKREQLPVEQPTSDIKEEGEKKENKFEGIVSNIPTGISSELTGGPNTGLLDLAQSFMDN